MQMQKVPAAPLGGRKSDGSARGFDMMTVAMGLNETKPHAAQRRKTTSINKIRRSTGPDNCHARARDHRLQ